MPFDLIIAGISGIFGGGSLLLTYRQISDLGSPPIVRFSKNLKTISFKEYWDAKRKEDKRVGSIHKKKWEAFAIDILGSAEILAPVVQGRIKTRIIATLCAQLAVAGISGLDFDNIMFPLTTGAFEIWDVYLNLFNILLPHHTLEKEKILDREEIRFFNSINELSEWFYTKKVKDKLLDTVQAAESILAAGHLVNKDEQK